MSVLAIVLAVVMMLISYLSGSLCSAVLISRLFSLPDPRTEGSNNPGATNVLRLSGKKYAIIVLIADMLKGLLPVLIAKLCGLSMFIVGLCALSAVLGHIFPIFFNFKGGKGVATALGVLLGMHPLTGSLVLGTWLTVAFISHFSSLASMVSICMAPVYFFFLTHDILAIRPLVMIALLILYKHQGNIKRLIRHEEPQIDLKSKLNKK